ncbi:hypothetical protein T484DRAFT_1921264 [Baffinella frigidus]|nr:hypothetical protein T484DRAFT_1921264 [Cryptophyta sp. CCMP2293]
MRGSMKTVGGKHKGSSRVRDKILRVEASLALLDNLAVDKSALLFDWDHCDSVEHESKRNSFRNSLVDDISEEGVVARTVIPDGWSIKARVRRVNTDMGSRRAKNWLDELPSSQFTRCNSLSERSCRSTGDMAESGAVRHRGARRVSLLLWPPEFMPRDVPSCDKGVAGFPAHPVDFSRRQKRARLVQQLKATDSLHIQLLT